MKKNLAVMMRSVHIFNQFFSSESGRGFMELLSSSLVSKFMRKDDPGPVGNTTISVIAYIYVK